MGRLITMMHSSRQKPFVPNSMIYNNISMSWNMPGTMLSSDLRSCNFLVPIKHQGDLTIELVQHHINPRRCLKARRGILKVEG